MVAIVERVTKVPFAGFSLLKAESIREGYQFLEKLELEWSNRKNRFDKVGEGFYLIKVQNEVVGVGGINNNPFNVCGSKIGRLRRFYIANAWRRKGLGSFLLDYLITEYSSCYGRIQLRTNDEKAKLFYEKKGFQAVNEQENVTHQFAISDSVK